MRRTKEEAAVTRETLLKAALSVFSANGYSATTLEDIAREAGLTRGAIYWHFGSKAELYNTLLQQFSARGAIVAEQAVAEGSSLLEVLRRVFVRQLALIEEDEEVRAVVELALLKTELSPELDSGRRHQVSSGKQLIAQLADVVQQGIQRGELRADLDAADIARAFLAFQNGAIQLWLAAPEAFSIKASAEAFAGIFIAGVRADK